LIERKERRREEIVEQEMIVAVALVDEMRREERIYCK
jgi:hypothetical protein